MPPGLVIIVAVAHGARSAAQPAGAAGARRGPPGQGRWPGGCGCGSGDTMNAFTTNDPGAADLLALARPGDDGCRVPAARQGHSLAAATRT